MSKRKSKATDTDKARLWWGDFQCRWCNEPHESEKAVNDHARKTKHEKLIRAADAVGMEKATHA